MNKICKETHQYIFTHNQMVVHSSVAFGMSMHGFLFLWTFFFIVEWINHLNGHSNGSKQMSNPLKHSNKTGKFQKEAKAVCVCVCVSVVFQFGHKIWVHLCGKALSSIVLENYRILSWTDKSNIAQNTLHAWGKIRYICVKCIQSVSVCVCVCPL